MTKLPSPMSLAFSTWLNDRMREQDITQADLARASGLTRQTINYYLSAKSKQPDEFALQKIAKGLRLPLEEVYRAAGTPTSIPTKSVLIDRIIKEIEELPPEEKENVLAYIEMMRRLAEKRRRKKG